MSTDGRVLVTGAAGQIGTALRAGLVHSGHSLRLLDVVDVPQGDDGAEIVRADVTDLDALVAAMSGVRAVVHLAGIPTEAAFESVLPHNVVGTYHVFEAARRLGVPRVVFASSNHATGFTPRTALATVEGRPRPDTLYGVSKVFGEAIGSLYADRYGMAVACLRIGSFADRPSTRRHLSTWLSPGDAVRLVHACLTAPDLRFEVVWGVSANLRAWWDPEPGRSLGYEPADDAEAFADEVLASAPPYDPAAPEEAFLGGEFAGPAYDDPAAVGPAAVGPAATGPADGS